MPLRLLLLFLAILVVGCKERGPPTTRVKSSEIATLAERVSRLEQYVTFRRTYETLDFDILYQNNTGGLAGGPSDWDVRLIATVPAAELQAWVPTGVQAKPTASDTSWLHSIPTQQAVSGVNEWYVEGGRVIGMDRDRRIIVYRASSM